MNPKILDAKIILGTAGFYLRLVSPWTIFKFDSQKEYKNQSRFYTKVICIQMLNTNKWLA